MDSSASKNRTDITFFFLFFTNYLGSPLGVHNPLLVVEVAVSPCVRSSQILIILQVFALEV